MTSAPHQQNDFPSSQLVRLTPCPRHPGRWLTEIRLSREHPFRSSGNCADITETTTNLHALAAEADHAAARMEAEREQMTADPIASALRLRHGLTATGAPPPGYPPQHHPATYREAFDRAQVLLDDPELPRNNRRILERIMPLIRANAATNDDLHEITDREGNVFETWTTPRTPAAEIAQALIQMEEERAARAPGGPK